MREFMELVVKAEGFRVETALDGIQAVQKAIAVNPDLIVLDLILPGKGGYEVLHDLQAEGCGSIPVVMVTGRAIDAKLKEMLTFEPNVRDLLKKPLPKVFAKSLHGYLRTRPPVAI
jgi:CheY-like chemotaxis protein